MNQLVTSMNIPLFEDVPVDSIFVLQIEKIHNNYMFILR